MILLSREVIALHTQAGIWFLKVRDGQTRCPPKSVLWCLLPFFFLVDNLTFTYQYINQSLPFKRLLSSPSHIMPIAGLANIFLNDYKSFKVCRLQNSHVIIDGEDFSKYIYENEKLSITYGGEYLSYAVQLKQFLREIKQCKIDPTFIFGSDCERVGFQLSSQLQVIEYLIKSLSSSSSSKDAKIHKVSVRPYLGFLQSVLVDILNDMEVKLLKSPYPRIRSCISLATHLNYPIIGSSAEYFLVNYHQSDSHKSYFIPLPLIFRQSYKADNNKSTSCNNEQQEQQQQPPPSAAAATTTAAAELMMSNEDNEASSSSSSSSCTLTENSSDSYLTTHTFQPSTSPLARVNTVCRPFIGLILGSDTLPNTKLPAYLYPIMHSIDEKDYKSRRLSTLISWFSQFTTNPKAPINEILKSYPTQEKGKILKIFTEVVTTYIPDQQLAENLALLLIHQSNSITSESQLNRLNFISHSKEPNTNKELQLWEKRFNDLLKINSNGGDVAVVDGKSTNIILGTINFIHAWPDNLFQLYIKHKLAPLILTPIYCHGGVVFPIPSVESLQIESSVYEFSLPLRWMHYRIFCGLEHQLAQRQKLIGLTASSQLFEHFCTSGKTLTTFRIHIDPLILNMNKDSTDQLIASLVGVSFTYFKTEFQWMISLALTLAYWFRESIKNKVSTGTTDDQLGDISQSSVVLAIAAIAVCNYFNVEESDEETVKHYGVLITFLKNKITTTTTEQSSINTSIVDHLTTVHYIYIYLRSLTNLLDHLLPSDKQKSSCLTFLPNWIVFPSGCLFYNLVNDLEVLKPEDRFRLTSRYWLPRIYRIPKLSPEYALKLKKLTETFEHVIHITKEMIRLPLTVPKINYTKEPTVIPPTDLSATTSGGGGGGGASGGGGGSRRRTRSIKSTSSNSYLDKKSQHKPVSLNSDIPTKSWTPVPSYPSLPSAVGPLFVKTPFGESSNRYDNKNSNNNSDSHQASSQSLTNLSKKPSKRVPYHSRSTGYAARLLARLEDEAK
ncbi:unnamed protein product [Trichobilharzia szidati]|nr:unnamed protein product [Trichobilharzia szidati]